MAVRNDCPNVTRTNKLITEQPFSCSLVCSTACSSRLASFLVKSVHTWVCNGPEVMVSDPSDAAWYLFSEGILVPPSLELNSGIIIVRQGITEIGIWSFSYASHFVIN